MAKRALVTIKDVEKAAESINGSVIRTPTIQSPALSALYGCNIFLKLESLQRTGSFKERGALNKLSLLDKKVAKRGVIACSAGNHAQGVAYHASSLKIPSTIIMPNGTPYTKIQRTKSYGAKVVLHGASLDDCFKYAKQLAKDKKLTFIHPYDDKEIMAGQGTIALEMLADVPELDILIVPIGGGGLMGGIATAAKSIKPKIKIIGVETELFPAMQNLITGKRTKVGGNTIAEGIAVAKPSKAAAEIVHKHVSAIEIVSEKLIEMAIYDLLHHGKLVAEGAGAAGIAAILKDPSKLAGKNVGVVICGGNIDSRVLSTTLQRALVRNGQVVHLRLEIPDIPGVLASVSKIIGEAGANIIEVIHQRLLYEMPLKNAELELVIETQDKHHVSEIVKKLEKAGFKTELLSYQR